MLKKALSLLTAVGMLFSVTAMNVLAAMPQTAPTTVDSEHEFYINGTLDNYDVTDGTGLTGYSYAGWRTLTGSVKWVSGANNLAGSGIGFKIPFGSSLQHQNISMYVAASKFDNFRGLEFDFYMSDATEESSAVLASFLNVAYDETEGKHKIGLRHSGDEYDYYAEVSMNAKHSVKLIYDVQNCTTTGTVIKAFWFDGNLVAQNHILPSNTDQGGNWFSGSITSMYGLTNANANGPIFTPISSTLYVDNIKYYGFKAITVEGFDVADGAAKLTFNEKASVESIEEGVSLKDSETGAPIDFTVAADHDTCTYSITPADVDGDTLLRLDASGIMNIYETKTMAADYANAFTLNGGSVIQPIEVTTSIANGATGVSKNLTYNVVFNQEMKTGTITEDYIKLIDTSTGNELDYTGSYNSDTNTWTISGVELEDSTTYKVQVLPGVQNMFDITIEAALEFTFTTVTEEFPGYATGTISGNYVYANVNNNEHTDTVNSWYDKTNTSVDTSGVLNGSKVAKLAPSGKLSINKNRMSNQSQALKQRVYEFDFLYTGTGTTYLLGDGANSAPLYITGNNLYLNSLATKKYKIATLSENTKYNIKMIVDFTGNAWTTGNHSTLSQTRVMAIYINGIRLLTNDLTEAGVRMSEYTVSSINVLGTNWGGGGRGFIFVTDANKTLYLDNLAFYGVKVPAVTSNIADASEDVDVTSSLALTFSVDMREETIPSAITLVKTADSSAVAFTGSYDSESKTYTIIPEEKLDFLTQYTLSVSNAAKSMLYGAGSTTLSFTTETFRFVPDFTVTVPDATKIVAGNNSIDVTVKNEKASTATGKLIFAVYKNVGNATYLVEVADILDVSLATGAQTVKNVNLNLSALAEGESYSAKIFVWDDLAVLCPLSLPVEI